MVGRVTVLVNILLISCNTNVQGRGRRNGVLYLLHLSLLRLSFLHVVVHARLHASKMLLERVEILRKIDVVFLKSMSLSNETFCFNHALIFIPLKLSKLNAAVNN